MNNDSFKDYYKILQVDRNAAQEVITVAYKSLAKKYHPDLNLNNLNEANEKMKDINEAYRTLSNSESRKNYNLTYDSYRKSDIDISDADDSSINNDSVSTTYNSYMTRKSRKEYTKKYNVKSFNSLKFNKRNLVIASIIAIFFICVIAENIIISSAYAPMGRIHKGIGTEINQTDGMRSDFGNNHIDNSHNYSGKPIMRGSSN